MYEDPGQGPAQGYDRITASRLLRKATVAMNAQERAQSTAASARPAPVGDEVYQELLSLILSSQLRPGGRITIDAVAREFGVSQTPIREALHRLDADGLVVRHHMAGYRVAPKMTRDQFEGLVEIRLLLEPAAARRAAENASVEELGGLKDLAKAMEPEMIESSGERGYARFSQLDADFHDAIAAGSRNGFIREALARLHTHVHLFRLSDHAAITAKALGEHADIVAAIGRRDPDGAAYAMRHHVEASATRFRSAFD